MRLFSHELLVLTLCGCVYRSYWDSYYVARNNACIPSTLFTSAPDLTRMSTMLSLPFFVANINILVGFVPVFKRSFIIRSSPVEAASIPTEYLRRQCCIKTWQCGHDCCFLHTIQMSLITYVEQDVVLFFCGTFSYGHQYFRVCHDQLHSSVDFCFSLCSDLSNV